MKRNISVCLSGWLSAHESGGCNYCDSRADVKELRGKDRCIVVRLCRNCLYDLKALL